MRLLDLSVATLIGLSSVTALAAWNPNQLVMERRYFSEQASLRDFLATVISTVGMPWFHRSSPDAICAVLLSLSNSTVQLSAEGRNYLCLIGPPDGVPKSSLTLVFPEGNLTLLAWQLARQ